MLGFTEDGHELATMDMNDVQSMLILGEPNYGKTNTIEVMVENALGRLDNANNLREPFGVVVTHWGPDPYAPGPRWADALKANNQPRSVERLCRTGILPRGIDNGGCRGAGIGP